LQTVVLKIRKAVMQTADKPLYAVKAFG